MASWTGTRFGVIDSVCVRVCEVPFASKGVSFLVCGEGRGVVSMMTESGCLRGYRFDDVAQAGFMCKIGLISPFHRKSAQFPPTRGYCSVSI